MSTHEDRRDAGGRANEEQAEYWNEAGAQHWLRYRERYDMALAPFTVELLRGAALRRSDRVLDVGCGSGATTRAVAGAVTDGEAVGIDLSAPMLAIAAELAERDGLTNVRFVRGDAQTQAFTSGRFDVALSRFGMMFFDSTVAALRNIARALRPGGRLAFVCWREFVLNEWLLVPATLVLEQVDATLPAADGAGPFSMADPERLQQLVGAGGFEEFDAEPIAPPVILGATPEDAAAFLLETRVARTLLAGVDAQRRGNVERAIVRALEPRLGPSGVTLGSAAWLVTATRGATGGSSS